MSRLGSWKAVVACKKTPPDYGTSNVVTERNTPHKVLPEISWSSRVGLFKHIHYLHRTSDGDPGPPTVPHGKYWKSKVT